MPNYSFNTQNHVRIWFSGKRNVILNQENQLRMVRFRHQNPNANMTLVYSSVMLDNNAQEQLKAFCQKHKFNPLDFDTALKRELIEPLDCAMYTFAKLELDACVANKGGNLGAASDLTRLIIPLLVKGTYSDFDTNIKINALPEIMNIKAPLMMNIGSLKGYFENPVINNDIIGISIQNGIMDPIAKNYIQRIQQEVVKVYESGAENTLMRISKSTFEADESLLKFYSSGHFTELFSVYPNPTITDFRWLVDLSTKTIFSSLRVMKSEYFNDFKSDLNKPLRKKLLKALSDAHLVDFPADIDEIEQNIIKKLYLEYSKNIFDVYVLSTSLSSSSSLDELKALNARIKSLNDPDACLRLLNSDTRSLRYVSIKDSVIHFSGPRLVMRSLFEGNNRVSFKELSFDYNGLFEHFNSDQSIKLQTSIQDYQKANLACDASWLSEGKQLINKKERLMNDAAKVIQRRWKQHLQDIKMDHQVSIENCKSISRLG